MVFSSLIFVFTFLPLAILIYYIVPHRFKHLVLLLFSLLFYGWGEPFYIILMIITSSFDYTCGLLLGRYDNRPVLRRTILVISVVVNIGILCFFKYYSFIVTNINSLTGLNITDLKLPLPIGISFYTFQAMSYVIEVYQRKVKVQKNIIDFGTFVTMFPQLVAGPIVKYGEIADQLKNRRESRDLFGEGVQEFIAGLAKKVLIANNIGILWDSVKSTPISDLTILSSWLGIIAFTFQIYYDFSGYSNMAIGMGKMFGFKFLVNFNYPYIAKSVTEFWRRWHISLGSWFREYVYIPMGGNRVGTLKLYRNLIVVWFLTGLWHGASWNFVLWGLYFGLFIIIEKMFLGRLLGKLPGFAGNIYTLLVAVIGWVLFEFESLSKCGAYLGLMFGAGRSGSAAASFLDSQALYYLSANAALFVIAAACATPFPARLADRLRHKAGQIGTIAFPAFNMALLFITAAYMVNESYNPFLYFRF